MTYITWLHKENTSFGSVGQVLVEIEILFYLRNFFSKIQVNILLDENAEDEKEKKEKNKEPEWMINSTVTDDDPYRYIYINYT